MKEYIAHYFNHGDGVAKCYTISASNRIEAIEKFDELFPRRMLVSVKSIKD